MSEPRVPPTAPPRSRPRRPTVMMLVIYVVGAALLMSLVGIITLALREQSIPDPLSAIAGSSLTGLVALLAKRDTDS